MPYQLLVDNKDFKMYALDIYMYISPKKTKTNNVVTADTLKR